MTEQTNLFHLFASPPPAPVLPAGVIVHWVVVTTRRASTGCGTIVEAVDWKNRQWATQDGAALECSLDGFSAKVTCARCKDALT